MWKHIRNLIAPVVASLLVVSIANGAMYQWSKTASSNSNADSSINWAEGMSPSSVNDSARAMMARVAEWRDDISGSLTGGGTSTAYTLTTNQGIATPTPTTGQMLSFVPSATNGSGVTLAVDGGTAYPIRTDASTAIPSGTLIAGTPYTMTFNGSAWVVRDYYASASVTNNLIPIGAIIPYTGSSAPNSNFVLPAGQCISRTTYATYFALVSTTFGTCDGTTTFGVPDLRGRVIAALDNLNGSAASRLTSTYFGSSGNTVGNTGGAESATLTEAQLPVVTKNIPAQQPTFTYTLGSTTSGTDNRVSSISTSGGGNSVTTADDATPGSITFGSGNAHAIVQPTMVMTMILRIQ